MNENDRDSLIQLLTPVIKRLPIYGKIIYALYKKPEITKKQKVLLGAGLAYAISPIDVIPGFVPIIGQLDDIVVALYSLRKVLIQLSEEDREEVLDNFEITMGQLEEDIETANRVSKQVALTGLKYTGKGVWSLGKYTAKIFNAGGKILYRRLFK